MDWLEYSKKIKFLLATTVVQNNDESYQCCDYSIVMGI